MQENTNQDSTHHVVNQSNRSKTLFRRLLLLLATVVYTAAVAFVSIQLYKRHQVAVTNAINPHTLIQQALINDLSLKTVTRRVTYRDNLDQSMLVTWDVQSDFSNFNDSKSTGTLTINYLKGKSNNTQQVEFVAVKGNNQYTNTLYVRMVKGNELTNAPTNWFTFQSSSVWKEDTLKDLFQRSHSANSFTNQIKLPGFDNFEGFDIAQYNSPAAYIITANLRDSQEKAKIISELQNDKAYVLQDCNHDLHFSWCGGSVIIGGLVSINTNLATSEGGPGGLTGRVNNSSQFWFTADNKQKQLTKLEIDVSTYGNDYKYIVEYSHYNEPVSITIPKV